jgi:hypothetical protein
VLLTFPIFAYGAGWGAIYLVLAVVTMGVLRWRGLEWAALLPGIMPLGALIGVGLVGLPLAGALLRRWGALVGFLSGLTVTVAAGFPGWNDLPYTFTPGPGPVLLSTHHAGSPWTVLMALARFLDSRPELGLQILLFSIFSLPLYTLGGRSPERRMWGASSYLLLLFLAFVLLPILVIGSPVRLGAFLVAYVPCAIIAYLVTFLIPSQRVGSV